MRYNPFRKAISAARSAAGSGAEGFARRSRLAVVPEDRLGGAAGAAVVQQAVMAVDALDQAEAPERRRPPLAAGCRAVRAAVGETLAHVVEEEIGVRMDGLVAELGQRRVAAGGERRHVARGTAETAEQLAARASTSGRSRSRATGTASVRT